MSQNIEALRNAADAIAGDVESVRALIASLRGIVDDLKAQIEAGQSDQAAIAEITARLTAADASLDAITEPGTAGTPPAPGSQPGGGSVIDIAKANEAKQSGAPAAGGTAGAESQQPPGTVEGEESVT